MKDELRKIAIVGHGTVTALVQEKIKSLDAEIQIIETSTEQAKSINQSIGRQESILIINSYRHPEGFNPPLTRRERRAKERRNKKP